MLRKITLLLFFIFLQQQLLGQRQIPIITGDTAVFTADTLFSCFYPDFDSATIYVQIPANLKIDTLYAASHYSARTPATLAHGKIYLSTLCGNSPIHSGFNLPGLYIN